MNSQRCEEENSVVLFPYTLTDYNDSGVKNPLLISSINTTSLFLLIRMNTLSNQHLTNAIMIPPLRQLGKLSRDDLIHYETSVKELQ